MGGERQAGDRAIAKKIDLVREATESARGSESIKEICTAPDVFSFRRTGTVQGQFLHSLKIDVVLLSLP